MQNNINFGGNQRWAAVSDSFNQRLAGSMRLPLFARLVFLAEARMNRIGHAEFATGELESLLPTIDRKTGEIRYPSQNTICKAIKVAIEEGFFTKDSSVRCLVFHSNDVQRSAKASSSCNHHGVKKDWDGAIKPVSLVKAESPQEITEAPEDQEETTEAQTATEAPSQPCSEETDHEATDEQQEEATMPIEEQQPLDIDAWFEREDIAEVSKNVAAYGITFRKGHPYEYILAVAEEAAKEEHDIWGNNFNMRYTYAAQKVDESSIPVRDTRTLVDTDAW